MTEREQLEQAIAVLDSQRAILGDAVVDAALAPMREKLALLQAQATPPSARQTRKQVTVLFADVSGFTAMAETMDVEVMTEIMNALWAGLDRAIVDQGGQIDKHMGDGVMALWGVQAAREDDPERAIRAALEMQAALAAFTQGQNPRLGMRIGLSTGPVLLGEIGSTHEFTAMGDTVNLAARLEQAAPIGGILIPLDTYRHVRGVFDVLPQAPLAVKGKAAQVQTYAVQRAKPRLFRMSTRGIEGIETCMVERQAEMLALQNALAGVVGTSQPPLVLVVGEAGVGKSRLLSEFETWLDLRPEEVYLLRGRATPAWQNVPYSLVRDMFAHRFDILESDSAAAALSKFRAGMAGILAPERADLVGHLVGFDFHAAGSPAVRNLHGSPDFRQLAQTYLSSYLQTMANDQPLAMFLEDLHWADDSSLDLVEQVLAASPQARLLLVGLTRPTLFERRPAWGQDQAAWLRIDLRLLSRAASRALVEDILQKVTALPDVLRDLVVEGAEGNPFYVEELVKMLLDDGVIERGPDTLDEWSVSLERLKQVRVPPTLTGILQARLDSLPDAERELLQRAAVVGRLFWDAAVADLAATERVELDALLDAVRARELVFRQDRSAFEGTDEYLFKHALLRDVTYETVLLKLRRGYHAQVACWLERHAGERIGEYAALIADHLEQAGQTAPAAGYLRQAGTEALAAGAMREAIGFFRRALALLPAEDPGRAGLLVQAGEALWALGEFDQARQQLEAGAHLAQQRGDAVSRAAALDWLGVIAGDQGDQAQAKVYLKESLALARATGDRARIAHLMWALGWDDLGREAYAEAWAAFVEGQAIYHDLGDRRGLALVLIGQCAVALALKDHDKARKLLQESLALFRATGDRRGEAATLSNLGEVARMQQDYSTARRYFEEGLAIAREIGVKVDVVFATNNLGHTLSALGDHAAATACYQQAIQIAMGIGATPSALDSVAGLAGVLSCTGQAERALELLGLAADHPALMSETRPIVEQVLATLRCRLGPEAVEAGLARGRALRLETVVARCASP